MLRDLIFGYLSQHLPNFGGHVVPLHREPHNRRYFLVASDTAMLSGAN